jgi:hypothetical protein
MKLAAPLSPTEVLAQVALALPESARSSVIIIGSLAAGFHFFSGDGVAAIRTKDVDCLLAPNAKAVAAAVEVTEQLLSANWTQRHDGKWGAPGAAELALEALPMVRLQPPGGKEWFLELLAAPPEYAAGEPDKKLARVHTTAGDFAICSFDFLALAEWKPLVTQHGVRIARPEMMALSNLLHHPTIGETLMAGTDYKRANKDLGRVLALAHLTVARDRKDNTDELSAWPRSMRDALQLKFGNHAKPLAQRAGSGINALMASAFDLQQALRIANTGLLTSLDVSVDAFMATGRRLQADVLEPLAGS